MKIKLISLAAIRGFLLLSIALTVGPVFGDTNRYAGDNWAFMDTKQVLAAAADITPAKYPDCDDATVDLKMVRVYRADGTGEAQDEGFTKVLTEKGKRGNRTVTLSYMLPYSTAEAVKIEVIKPNGDIEPVDIAANLKDTIDDSQMQMNIYDPNSHVIRVNIPKVEIGDVVHTITRQTTERPIVAGEFAEENVFEGGGYIRHLSYEVHAPGDRPLKKIALRDEVPGTVKYTSTAETDGGMVHHWEATDVPRMFDEPAMPSYSVVLQRLFISTTPDWQTLSKWYWGLSKQHLDNTGPDMEKTVNELTAKAKTDHDRLMAIFYYVSKNIRYMGLTPEKDRPGFEPHDVSITFDKKYGVCRDKAALLVSMLKAAHFPAYPVLICVGAKKDQEVADPFFNHAIVCVEFKPGEYTLMDPTDEHTRDLLPSSDCDQSYLVCRPEGETLKTSPIHPPEENMLRLKTTGTLSAAGSLDAKSELTFDGVNDDAYRGAFSHMKPDDKRRFFESALKRSMPAAKLKSLTITPSDMMNTTVPLRVELEFTAEGITATSGGKSVVTVPWLGKGMGVANFILGGAGLDKRKYPMQTQIACGVKEDISLTLADNFTGVVSMPSCPAVEDNCITYHQTFGFTNSMLSCSRELKLKVVEFSPSEYLTLKKTLKSLEYDGRKIPVLAASEKIAVVAAKKSDDAAPAPIESNARVLAVSKELNVTDAHAAVYKVKYSKEILNYAGKIREAELKIGFNPSCEDARLIRAVVTSKDGKRQEISTNEINIMDAGWNASAKRYTGGKILVANLPGVDIGSTIEVEYEVASKGKPFVAGFESFQIVDDLTKKSFILTAPRDVKIQKLISGTAGNLGEEKTSANGNQSLTWHVENVKPLPAESQVPPEWVYNTGVGYFVGDSKAYLKDLNDAMLDRSKNRTEVAEMVRKLANQCKGQRDTVKAIRDFVAKSIRLAGPSFTELPLSELSAADTTFKDGYGHAADRAILLHAMLSAAGFQPEFVLASGLPPIAEINSVAKSFPLPNSFYEPLVRVKLDGESVYLNDTDQYAELGSTGYDGRLGIVLASRASEIIKAPKDRNNKMETLYTISIGEGGKARIGVTQNYYGASFDFKNRYFSELPPEERKRYFQQLVSGMAQGARPVGELTTKFDTYPGVEQFTVDIDNYSVVDGKYQYFDLPFTPSLMAAGADRRTLPLFISGHGENSVRTEIDLPAGFRHIVMAPKTETLEMPDGGGKAKIVLADAGGKCILTHSFETSPTIIPPKDYAAMLKVESALRNKSSTIFLLEKD